MVSVYDSPRDLVWKTMVDPKLIPEWIGPKALTTDVKKWDMRPGGTWRFVQRDPEGKEYAFNGKYVEVVPNKRYTTTFEYEGVPGHILNVTVTLEDKGGKTELSQKTSYKMLEDLDGMLKSGMEAGMRESMARFGELLKRVNKQ